MLTRRRAWVVLWLAVFLLPVVLVAPRAAAAPVWGPESAIVAYLHHGIQDMRIVGLQVTVVGAGATVFNQGFGSADGAGRPVDEHTVFALGSVSKQFTGRAVQRLVAEGKLDLDSTVHSVFPGFGDGTDDHSRITVRQLLTHTSGFDTASGLAGWVASRRGADLQTEVERLSRTPLVQPPGSGFIYSNSNYNLLGAIVEHETGQPFAEAMQNLVFGPAGLAETSVGPVQSEARGQYPWLGVWSLPTPGVEPRTHAPSAYIRSTSHDLTALIRAELNAKPGADPDLLLISRTPLAQADEYTQYASGLFVHKFWALNDHNDGDAHSDLPIAYDHSGSTDRTASQLLFCPELGFGLVVLSNTAIGLDTSKWDLFIDGLVHTILGTSASEPPPEDALLALAPFLLVTLPVLQTGTLIWVGRSTRRTGKRAWPAVLLALVVHTAAMVLVFWIAPTKNPNAPSLEKLWEGSPDVGAASILATLMALTLAGLLGTRLTRALTRPQGHPSRSFGGAGLKSNTPRRCKAWWR